MPSCLGSPSTISLLARRRSRTHATLRGLSRELRPRRCSTRRRTATRQRVIERSDSRSMTSHVCVCNVCVCVCARLFTRVSPRSPRVLLVRAASRELFVESAKNNKTRSRDSRFRDPGPSQWLRAADSRGPRCGRRAAWSQSRRKRAAQSGSD